MDPKNPVTVAYYDTYLGPPNDPNYRTPVFNGAAEKEIDADELIHGVEQCIFVHDVDV